MKTPPKAKISPALDRLPARLRVGDVALYLNCSEEHVCNLIRSGALLAVDVSTQGSAHRTYRVTKEALIAFEQARKA